MIKFIKLKLHEHLNCLGFKPSDEVIKFVSGFKSDEELLRNGGLPIEMLDRLAHGFSEDDLKELSPKDLNIKWKDDWDNVKWEVKKSGLSPKKWSQKINLTEPIDVVFENGKFFIDDGHHRFFAAKTLNKSLPINLEIKDNPITKLTPNLGYDEFHRCLYRTIKGTIKEEISPTEAYTPDSSIQTLIDNKRDVAFIHSYNINYYKDIFDKHNISYMKIPVDNINYILYKASGIEKAKELFKIAMKYGGELSYRASAEDTVRIGQLLGYKKEDINNFIKKIHGIDLI
jgi:hypothetical protein